MKSQLSAYLVGEILAKSYLIPNIDQIYQKPAIWYLLLLTLDGQSGATTCYCRRFRQINSEGHYRQTRRGHYRQTHTQRVTTEGHIMESLFLQNTFWKAMTSGLKVVVGGEVGWVLPAIVVCAPVAALPMLFPAVVPAGAEVDPAATVVEEHAPVCATVRWTNIQAAWTYLQLEIKKIYSVSDKQLRNETVALRWTINGVKISSVWLSIIRLT